MPSIPSDTRIVLGIIAAIASIFAAILGNVLAINIVHFFTRRGRRPTKRPIHLWFFFYFSAFISVVLGSLAAFAPTPPVDNISSIFRKSINDAPADIKSALRNLSQRGFLDLIKDGKDTPGEKLGLGNDCVSEEEFYKYRPSYLEFQSRGLLVMMPEKETECSGYKFYWTWTPLGSRSYEFVLDIIGNVYSDIRLEVEQELATRASVEIKNAVSGLSKDAFLKLVLSGVDKRDLPYRLEEYIGYYCDTTKEDIYTKIPGMAELEKRGIIEFVYQNQTDCPSFLLWHFTSLGDDAYVFVVDIISQALADAAHVE